MDKDIGDVSPNRESSFPRLKSTVAGGGSSSVTMKIKGRGFLGEASTVAEKNARLSAPFGSFDSEGGPGPECSIEGWIILVTGVHEEAQEDDLQNAFGGLGEMKNLHLNLVKGYALIEYENFDEARRAINGMDGSKLLTRTINVDWAFSKGPPRKRSPGGPRSRSPRGRF